MSISLLPTWCSASSKFKRKVYEAGLRKSQALDTHTPTPAPKRGLSHQDIGPGHWGQRAICTRLGTRLTCTVTPAARAAQAPTRHSTASRKVFMAAVPKRKEWLVPDTTEKRWDFKRRQGY